jgi:hypothetical protein
MGTTSISTWTSAGAAERSIAGSPSVSSGAPCLKSRCWPAGSGLDTEYVWVYVGVPAARFILPQAGFEPKLSMHGSDDGRLLFAVRWSPR